MAIREGAPQPIIAILVGVGRVRRELGEREEDGDERVRMYSWQLPQKKCLTKMTSTRLGQLGPEYKLLNGTLFPSPSKIG